MVKKLTEKALIKKLDTMSREELTKIAVDLFKTNKIVEAKLNLLFLGEAYGMTLMKKYKKCMYKIFNPSDIVRNNPMGFLEWMGFSKPRDAPEEDRPEEKLPEVTDSVRDSGQIFAFGTASSGEKVDEQFAMQISTAYACVRVLAETVAALPLHLYRYTDNGKGKERVADHPLYRILYRQPNDEMSSFTWRETLMTHLLLCGNAYCQIIRDGRNNVLGLYPLLPENV